MAETPPSEAGPESGYNWPLAESMYRAGTASIKRIASESGIPETTLRRRAAAAGWSRDTRKEVLKLASESLLRRPTEEDRRPPLDDEEAINQAADDLSGVIRRQRTVAMLGVMIGHDMLRELSDEKAKAKMPLAARAQTLQRLADATAKLTASERTFWGLDKKDPDDELKTLTEAQLEARLKALESQLNDASAAG